MATYRAIYRQDESGWWIVEIEGVQGCHSQGRTVPQARERVREALALCIGDEEAEQAEIVDDVRAEPAP